MRTLTGSRRPSSPARAWPASSCAGAPPRAARPRTRASSPATGQVPGPAGPRVVPTEGALEDRAVAGRVRPVVAHVGVLLAGRGDRTGLAHRGSQVAGGRATTHHSSLKQRAIHTMFESKLFLSSACTCTMYDDVRRARAHLKPANNTHRYEIREFN